MLGLGISWKYIRLCIWWVVVGCCWVRFGLGYGRIGWGGGLLCFGLKRVWYVGGWFSG